MKVYFRNNDGSLGLIKVDEEVTDHEEAIILVCEELVAQGTGYNNPVLVVIK
jgi:hypothetical protein